MQFAIPAGLNGNQSAVADALVNSFNVAGGIPLAFGLLSPTGLSLASGEIATAPAQAAFDAQKGFMGLLPTGDPLPQQDALAQEMGYAPSVRGRTPAERDAYAAMASFAPASQAFEKRWRMFGGAFGSATGIAGAAAVGSHRFDGDAYGVAAGGDYQVANGTRLGFALGGGGTTYALAQGLGTGRTDMAMAGLYGRQQLGAAYVSGSLSYGWHDVTTKRTSPFGEVLRGQYKAQIGAARIEAGWRIGAPLAAVTPYVAAQAVQYRLPGYAESGNGTPTSFALAYDAQDVHTTRTELGLRFDRAIALGDALWTLHGRAAWAHDYDRARTLVSSFQVLPASTFTVNGATLDPDAALVSLGGEIAWRSGFALSGTFDGEFSDNVSSYGGKGALKYTW